MEANTQSQPKAEEKKLCTKCTTFYGTIVTNFMCSKCFKDAGGVIEPTPSGDAKVEDVSIKNEEEKEPEKPIQEKKNRCWGCNKKVGLLGFACKCSYIFCAKHRFADDHACDYDHKKEGIAELIKQNPLLAESQFEKIN
mmetsp:Transcript_16993/g.18972  ORF Transcript_16993/g.18972 Transcript_16993/m.18972 type:complete len:139 (-) Transcript_16993:42-458(-)